MGLSASSYKMVDLARYEDAGMEKAPIRVEGWARGEPGDGSVRGVQGGSCVGVGDVD